jgi:NodT family efflux transporter outer membrane factor (OMF) lipoprotein
VNGAVGVSDELKLSSRVLAAVAAAGLVALSACGTANRLSLTREAIEIVETETPAGWAATDALDTPPQGDWIATFDDPALSFLIDDSLSSNWDLAAAASRLEQAREQARVAGAPLWPSVDANLTGSSTDYGDGLGAISGTENYGLSLSASWEADVWGRVRDSARAGAIDAFATEADFAGARLALLGAVARGWYDLTQARLLVQLAEDDVRTQERSLQLTQRRYESGVTGALDVRLSRSSLATSQAALYQSQNQRNNAARRLEVLLGRYPAAAMTAAPELPQLPDLIGAGTPGDLLVRRPDLRAAEARLESAGLRARLARKALLPRLTITGSGSTNVNDFDEVFDADYMASTIAGGLLQPIFRGGALRAEAGRARAAAEERLAAYANLALTAYREAEDALDAETALSLQEGALLVAVQEAREAELLAERNYSSGVGTIFELLDAQRRRINAERQYINTRAARVSNRVGFHLSIGGAADLDPESAPARRTSSPNAAPEDNEL